MGNLDDGQRDNQLGAMINDKRKSIWKESEETYNKSTSSALSPAREMLAVLPRTSPALACHWAEEIVVMGNHCEWLTLARH